MNPWLRFYREVLHDPKVQLLDPFHFKFWINCLCLACENDGYLPSPESVSFAFHLPESTVSEFIEILMGVGLIEMKRGKWYLHNWHKRQYKADISTERVKRFRKRHETVSYDVSETPPDTDTEQRQIQNRTEGIPRKRGRPKTEAPASLEISVEMYGFATKHGVGNADAETEAMLDHHRSKGNTFSDWNATWRTWMRNHQKFGGNGNGNGRSKPVRETDHEKNQRATEEFLAREVAREMRSNVPDVWENPLGLSGKV